MRTDGRAFDQLRPVSFLKDTIQLAEGSALIQMGHTHVICTASCETPVPKWIQGTGKGWITAEYGMLPRSTHQRMKRDKIASGGRTLEISRLIGRALRSCVNLSQLGEIQITLDCDVIQADGGTRTASVTGAYVALVLALRFLHNKGELKTLPDLTPIAAVSIGLRENEYLLDLNYDEDSCIDTDMNFVMNNKMEFVEIQGTAEGRSFSQKQMNEMMSLAEKGCKELFEFQRQILEI